MILLLSFLLFLLVFGFSVFVGMRYWAAPSAVIERILDRGRAIDDAHAAVWWHRVTRAISNKVVRTKLAGKAKPDTLQAEIRSSEASSSQKAIGAAAGAMVLATIAILRDADYSSGMMAVMAGAGTGYILPGEFQRAKIRRRKQRIERALPNALDLLTIAVEAGLGLDHAIVHVSEQLGRACPDISAEFAMINLETRAGKRRADALRGMAERTGVLEVKKFVAVLVQADRFGTSIAQSLRAHSEFLRIQASQRAEEKAAKLGVKMVFPIFFFILPSLFVMTVGPMLVRLFKDLLPLMNGL